MKRNAPKVGRTNTRKSQKQKSAAVILNDSLRAGIKDALPALAKKGAAVRSALGGSADEVYSDAARDRIRKAEASVAKSRRSIATRMVRHVTMSEIEGRTWALMNAGHVTLERLCDGIKSAEAQEIGHVADSMAQRAAFLSAYADARGANGCGDSGHNNAVRKAQKRLKAIRKTLGYTYP